jgi:hypothetical protein
VGFEPNHDLYLTKVTQNERITRNNEAITVIIIIIIMATPEDDDEAMEKEMSNILDEAEDTWRDEV